jgi:hypothetical protein
MVIFFQSHSFEFSSKTGQQRDWGPLFQLFIAFLTWPNTTCLNRPHSPFFHHLTPPVFFPNLTLPNLLENTPQLILSSQLWWGSHLNFSKEQPTSVYSLQFTKFTKFTNWLQSPFLAVNPMPCLLYFIGFSFSNQFFI